MSSRLAKTARRKRNSEIIKRLRLAYPGCQSAPQLFHRWNCSSHNPLAQCTDERVNLVTRQLFAKYPGGRRLPPRWRRRVAGRHPDDRFFRKRRGASAALPKILEDFGGRVPANMDALLTAARRGRKTANVVLGNAFDIVWLVVDTHVTRVRNAFADEAEATGKDRADLMRLVPQKDWVPFSHMVIPARTPRVCKALKPDCAAAL